MLRASLWTRFFALWIFGKLIADYLSQHFFCRRRRRVGFNHVAMHSMWRQHEHRARAIWSLYTNTQTNTHTHTNSELLSGNVERKQSMRTLRSRIVSYINTYSHPVSMHSRLAYAITYTVRWVKTLHSSVYDRPSIGTVGQQYCVPAFVVKFISFLILDSPVRRVHHGKCK